MNPCVSIIIPTANRPQWLPRAIESALAGMRPEDIEVVVVPNGPDNSWRHTIRPYRDNSAVKIVHVPEANANIARNAGLAQARGEYIRFLDDDDYLIPEGAAQQYATIDKLGVDVVSGNVRLEDDKGRSYNIWKQPAGDDLCAAVSGPKRVCLPVAHVYRRSVLKNARWNPDTSVRQDVEWLIDLCSQKELTWHKIDDVVGVWQHHWGQRVTSSKNFTKIRNKKTVPMIIRAYEHLKSENRLSDERRHAIAKGLWGFVHGAFYLEPIFWYRIARLAQQIDPTARPVQAFYHYPGVRHIDPLILQWMMLPKRRAFYTIRQFFKLFKIRINW